MAGASRWDFALCPDKPAVRSDDARHDPAGFATQTDKLPTGQKQCRLCRRWRFAKIAIPQLWDGLGSLQYKV